MSDWLLLTATLPTSPSALRVRIWRALKATLRDGVYLLPACADADQLLEASLPLFDSLYAALRTTHD